MDIVVPGLRFRPTYIRVRRGAEVTVTLRNTQGPEEFGAVHTFTIDAPAVNHEVGPGETTTFSFSLPADQAYVPFYCAIGGGAVSGHRPAGMQGAFYFE